MNQHGMPNFNFKLSCYETLWIVLLALARFLAIFSPKIRHHLNQRQEALTLLPAWSRLRSRYPKAALLVCSSAGEYEQGKPLIARLAARGDCAVFILFFSPSGLRFAASQKESLPYALVASDRPSYWKDIAAQLRPDVIVFVRYELWPGMVGVGQEFAPLILIDGVEAPHLRKKRMARFLRARLVKPMKRICVVSETDRQFYEEVLGCPPAKLNITGDTKYDRVLERIAERALILQRLRGSLQAFLQGRRILILGSAWPRDLQEFLSNYKQLRDFDPKVAVIIAPHDLSPSNIAAMQKMLNLGAGEDRKEGYVNVDWSPLTNPDVVHDLNSFPYPFEEESFDRIEAFHVLEHLDKPFNVMKELHRILAPGGTLHVKQLA